jgi:hypothetical protein
MTPDTRRNKIIEILNSATSPVAGSTLASDLNVSRQVIVQDVSILRAKGIEILATARGYMILGKEDYPRFNKTFAVRHHIGQMEHELNLIVDAGGKVVDVIVEHPVYGELKGNLMLKSRREVQEFIKSIEDTGSKMLSDVTDGVHLHTIEAETEDTLTHIEDTLKKAGLLLSSND